MSQPGIKYRRRQSRVSNSSSKHNRSSVTSIVEETREISKIIKNERIKKNLDIGNSIIEQESIRAKIIGSSFDQKNLSKLKSSFQSRVNKYTSLASSSKYSSMTMVKNEKIEKKSPNFFKKTRLKKSQLYRQLHSKIVEFKSGSKLKSEKNPKKEKLKKFFLKKKKEKIEIKKASTRHKTEQKFLSYLEYFKEMVQSEAGDFDYVEHIGKIFNLFIEAYYPDAAAKVLRDIDPTIDIRLMYEFMNHRLTKDIDHYVSGYARQLMMNYFEKFFVQAKEVLLFVTQTNSAKFFDALRKKDKRVQLLESRLAKLAEENQNAKLKLIKLEKANA